MDFLTRTDDGHIDPDLALLEALTAPTLPPLKSSLRRRDAELDPLLLAAAASSGPNATRNHYHHDFFPGVALPKAEGAWDWTKFGAEAEDAGGRQQRKRLTYVSKQGPRSQKKENGKENAGPSTPPLQATENKPLPDKRGRAASLRSIATPAAPPQPTPSRDVEVTCMARTRIPTPHGIAFLHLYHNNRDNKEHLALVVDPAQLSEDSSPISAPPIRSRSLDAVWNDSETEMERIIRGAYVGRLTPTKHVASTPSPPDPARVIDSVPPPLIRIHSECFTGETIGSQRCDCGEQLDEAIRLMAQPIEVRSPSALESSTRIPGRGVVVYMRQEGRGIGLLSKIRAYNLQDLGHDTVSANLMLGHQADERGYEVATAILRDLNLGSPNGEGVRLLTNNPDKVHAMEKEGLRIVERVPMVPRSWQMRAQHPDVRIAGADSEPEVEERKAGATLIKGDAVQGADLEKYLRTKVLRMGHMLELMPDASSPA
ncbi:hypothetical protein FA95DRAFT_1552240 [Auriscalpium vulgare]|uniref:Uncharacterized protein n=1 Tax=Auriscalpium vulgare TaxID=40419 RepID=A0ACB8SBY7_9AGAM|nr:hypothetical protein FA95DRAFT_1552240 [Auriscalpium vulgare]